MIVALVGASNESSIKDSPPCLGLAFGSKPGRTPVLLRRLTLGARRLRDFVDRCVFKQIYFLT